MRRKTKVEKHGAFWCVFVLMNAQWVRMRDLHLTRSAARRSQPYWSTY